MEYRIVEKDIEEKGGYIHPKIYTSLKSAERCIKMLRKDLSLEYYDLFIAEVIK